MMRRVMLWLTSLGLLLCGSHWPRETSAHDIPVDVVVLVFAKVDGPVLRVVMRVPLKALRDVEYPQQRSRLPGPGARGFAASRSGATLAASVDLGNR
jgi:hypothetical protein